MKYYCWNVLNSVMLQYALSKPVKCSLISPHVIECDVNHQMTGSKE